MSCGELSKISLYHMLPYLAHVYLRIIYQNFTNDKIFLCCGVFYDQAVVSKQYNIRLVRNWTPENFVIHNTFELACYELCHEKTCIVNFISAGFKAA